MAFKLSFQLSHRGRETQRKRTENLPGLAVTVVAVVTIFLQKKRKNESRTTDLLKRF